MTNSAKIARALMTLTGQGRKMFNDRIQGGRSIKVWGWKLEHYELAIQAMNKQGISAKLIKTPDIKGWPRTGMLRIHTQEG